MYVILGRAGSFKCGFCVWGVFMKLGAFDIHSVVRDQMYKYPGGLLRGKLIEYERF